MKITFLIYLIVFLNIRTYAKYEKPNTFIQLSSSIECKINLNSENLGLITIDQNNSSVELELNTPELLYFTHLEQYYQIVVFPEDSLVFTISENKIEVSGRGSNAARLYLNINSTSLNIVPLEESISIAKRAMFLNFLFLINSSNNFKKALNGAYENPESYKEFVKQYSSFDSLYLALNLYPINKSYEAQFFDDNLSGFLVSFSEIQSGQKMTSFKSLEYFNKCILEIRNSPLIKDKKEDLYYSLIRHSLTYLPEYFDEIVSAYNKLIVDEIKNNDVIEQKIENRKIVELENNEIKMPAINTLNEAFNPENYQQKLILIDFWATWCGPCIKIKPIFDEKSKKFKNMVKFITVSIDSDSNLWKNFVLENSMSQEDSFLLKEDNSENSFQSLFDINAIPRYLLISNSSKLITYRFVSPDSLDFDRLLEQEINK